MIRTLTAAALALLVAAPLSAQARDGWQSRVDRSTNASDPDDVPEVTIRPATNGFEVHTGPAVTLWNPANTSSGNYTVEGTFNLLAPSGHVNYYGLIFGGSALDGASQSYVYFLVGQNGTFTIRHRVNNETVHDIAARVEHAAVQRPAANGQSTNALAVRVGASDVQFVVNGQVVHTAPKSGMLSRTDGIWGVRINHVIPGVRIENLRATSME
jgi:hypothetical protein